MTTTRGARFGAVVAAGLLALTAACSEEAPESPPVEGTAPSTLASDATTYAALGDSYVSGPGIDPQLDDAGVCLRSGENWPHLVASALDLELDDVSCAGAGLLHLRSTVEGAEGPISAQVDAVEADTDLVTVGIGANDSQVFGSLVAGCGTSLAACGEYSGGALPEALKALRGDLTSFLRDVRRQAPDAVVLVTGYLPLAQPGESCAELPVAAGAVDLFVEGLASLDATVAEAAEAAGVGFVDVSEAGADHTVCSDDPWVNGETAPPGDGVELHQNAAGMAAVASLVEAAVAP